MLVGEVARRRSVEVSKLMTLLGRRLIRKVAVRKASSQNLSGMDACASKARPTSKI
jgi:hypothetical protein